MNIPLITIHQLEHDLTSGELTPEHLMTAAYLGYQPAQELLGIQSPDPFSLKSMLLGGDRIWRKTMRFLGHQAVAFAACEIAQITLNVYLAAPDSSQEVTTLAQDAVMALVSWKNDPHSEIKKIIVEEKAGRFCLAVDRELFNSTGSYGRQLGRVVGNCYSVVLDDGNLRYVRWLGDAAEIACRFFKISETDLCQVVGHAMIPFALGLGAS